MPSARHAYALIRRSDIRMQRVRERFASKSDRYQHQSYWVRLWRSRHFLPVPFWAVRAWLKAFNGKEYDPDEDGFADFPFWWTMACARAYMRMKHVYDF